MCHLVGVRSARGGRGTRVIPARGCYGRVRTVCVVPTPDFAASRRLGPVSTRGVSLRKRDPPVRVGERANVRLRRLTAVDGAAGLGPGGSVDDGKWHGTGAA